MAETTGNDASLGDCSLDRETKNDSMELIGGFDPAGLMECFWVSNALC